MTPSRVVHSPEDSYDSDNINKDKARSLARQSEGCSYQLDAEIPVKVTDDSKNEDEPGVYEQIWSMITSKEEFQRKVRFSLKWWLILTGLLYFP